MSFPRLTPKLEERLSSLENQELGVYIQTLEKDILKVAAIAFLFVNEEFEKVELILKNEEIYTEGLKTIARNSEFGFIFLALTLSRVSDLVKKNKN